MVRKGNLTIFESSNISETGEVTPTKINVRVCDINPYLHLFFEPIQLIKFFADHGLYANFISETEKATPTKIGVHACDINLYLHKNFEPISID